MKIIKFIKLEDKSNSDIFFTYKKWKEHIVSRKNMRCIIFKYFLLNYMNNGASLYT